MKPNFNSSNRTVMNALSIVWARDDRVKNKVVANAICILEKRSRQGMLAENVDHSLEWYKHQQETRNDPEWGKKSAGYAKAQAEASKKEKEAGTKADSKTDEMKSSEGKSGASEQTDKRQQTKKSREYGSAVQNTVNGIPKKEVREGFNMGVKTGSRDGDIKEVYRCAAESQKDFAKEINGIGSALGMKESGFENGLAVIGDGNCFFTRPVLKKEERVREKMDENDAESAKTGIDNNGINDIVDINGSTLVLGDGGNFKDAIKKIEDSGLKVVRVKNCFETPAYDYTGYGDVKVNVRTKNGFVGEVIIADRYTTEQKMNGAGHGLYEVTRSLTKAIDAKKPDVIENANRVRNAMNNLSRLVYLKDGEDHSTFEKKRLEAVLACQELKKIVDNPENKGYFEAKFKEELPKLIDKIKNPKTYDGYRAELKKRGL